MISKSEWERHLDKLVLKNLKDAYCAIGEAIKKPDTSACELAERALYDTTLMLLMKGTAKYLSEKECYFAFDNWGRPIFRKKSCHPEEKFNVGGYM